MKRDLKALIGQMTLEEKASLCSGSDFWHTQGIERLGIPAVMVTDGPHGLRKHGRSVATGQPAEKPTGTAPNPCEAAGA